MTGIFSLQNEESTETPLVFLHGFLGRPSMWNEVLTRLPTRHRVALGVLPGHGPAPWFPQEDSFVGAVQSMAIALPFTRPSYLIGYSMGARLALGLLHLCPQKFQGAILIGVDPGLRSEERRQARCCWDEQQALQIEQQGVEVFAQEWAALPIFATQNQIPIQRREAQQQERREHTTQGVAWAMRKLGLGSMPSWWSILSSCEIPLYIVTGELDRKFTDIGIRMSSVHSPARARGASDDGVYKAKPTQFPPPAGGKTSGRNQFRPQPPDRSSRLDAPSGLAADCTPHSERTRHIIVPNVGHNVVLEAPEYLLKLLDRCLAKQQSPQNH